VSAIIYSFAAERAVRRPNEQTPVAPKAWTGPSRTLPTDPRCIVCGDPDGIGCCEHGRDMR